MSSRVIAHCDLDCFYVGVEVARDESLRGVPAAVIQYNPRGNLEDLHPDANRRRNDSSGSIIAVSYEARAKGVKRNMRGDEARSVCPEIQLVQVPVRHGKACLDIYRDAGAKVLAILAQRGIAEKVSVDEAYLDLTDGARALLDAGSPGTPEWYDTLAQAKCSHVAGMDEDPTAISLSKSELRKGHSGEQVVACPASEKWWTRPPDEWTPDELLLAAGASIASQLREEVSRTLGYTISCGLATTKILAKLASGLHKPNQQTVVTPDQTDVLLKDLPVNRIQGLGGKLGQKIVDTFDIATIGELQTVSREKLCSLLGDKLGIWVHDLCRGQDGEQVKGRLLSKSVSCGKNFRGASALQSEEDVKYWLTELAKELDERLTKESQENKRVAKTLVLHFSEESSGSVSRNFVLRRGSIAADALARFMRHMRESWNSGFSTFSVTSMYLCAHGFETIQGSQITQFFATRPESSAPAPLKGASHSSPASPKILNAQSLDIRRELDESTCTLFKGASEKEPVDPEFLEALPLDIRRELEQSHQSSAASIGKRGRLSGPEDGGITKYLRKAAAPPVPASKPTCTMAGSSPFLGDEQIDLEVLASLPLNIRQEVEVHMRTQRTMRPLENKMCASKKADGGIRQFFTRGGAR